LFIPENLLDSLELSVERLLSQGRLADVIPIELDEILTEAEVEMILGLEYVDLGTKEGNVYHFVTEEKDPNSPLLLLVHESQFFFIPEDLLTDLEGSL
jgi:hypothetical protein